MQEREYLFRSIPRSHNTSRSTSVSFAQLSQRRVAEPPKAIFDENKAAILCQVFPNIREGLDNIPIDVMLASEGQVVYDTMSTRGAAVNISSTEVVLKFKTDINSNTMVNNEDIILIVMNIVRGSIKNLDVIIRNTVELFSSQGNTRKMNYYFDSLTDCIGTNDVSMVFDAMHGDMSRVVIDTDRNISEFNVSFHASRHIK